MMKPETPLPWTPVWSGGSFNARWDVGPASLGEMSDADAKYVAHACNAYPKLVEALKEVYAYGDALESEIELLRELGELDDDA